MTDSVFDEARRRVTASEVAALNGFHPNRSGYICCPFHNEKTPSLKLYPNGTWHCFGCHKGGSSIDFATELYNLTPLEAVRRLNDDFNLGLPLDRPMSKAEQAEAQHRREINDTYRQFEEWRHKMIRQLNQCFREGHFALKSLETPADINHLTDIQVLAIKEQARFEWLADILTGGTMAEMMEVFRERVQINQLCQKILRNTPKKSSVA